MALKPVLRWKVDELFLRWLSEPDTQQLLRQNLLQVSKGDTVPSLISGALVHTSSKGNKPRVCSSSPPYSPFGSKLSSPRSPRRSNFAKYISKSLNPGNAKNSKEKEVREIYQDRDKEKSKENVPIQTTAEPKCSEIPKKHSAAKPSQTASSALIPKFYFPAGQPTPSEQIDSVLQNVAQEFSSVEGGKIHKQQMAVIAKAVNLPTFWKSLLFHAAGGDKLGFITFQMFSSMWKKLCQNHHDEASKFVKLLAKPGCNYLVVDDFFMLIQDIVDTHPGLSFLQEAKEFHSRYIHTVISRIFFCVNRSWSGKITVGEVRKSNFLQTVALLDEEDDINQITDYFSYEHFYVIYCKFWELDKDHDLFIDKNDLASHNDHTISSRMIDRIFSGAVTRGEAQKEGKMSYPEFVWFLIAEEDKKNPTSIEYWCRCMDIDGDGVISLFEMEYFYEEQMQKMEALGIEKLPFEDCVCQMLDLVRPRRRQQITLGDLKACKMTDIFFDTFFNLEKFLDHEQRDPFANVRDPEMDGPELTDWEKYAAEEYENLLAEEGVNEELHYEDDFEPEEDDSIQEEGTAAAAASIDFAKQRTQQPRTSSSRDIYHLRNGDLHF